MPDTNHRQVLDGLLARRDTARDNVSRVKGKLDAARTELDEVVDECKRRKVKPEKLGEAIGTLETRLDEAVTDLRSEVEQAEQAVQPFLSEESA
jgi:predicted  nucleic acid-binding Zn-ribbon protein